MSASLLALVDAGATAVLIVVLVVAVRWLAKRLDAANRRIEQVEDRMIDRSER